MRRSFAGHTSAKIVALSKMPSVNRPASTLLGFTVANLKKLICSIFFPCLKVISVRRFCSSNYKTAIMNGLLLFFASRMLSKSRACLANDACKHSMPSSFPLSLSPGGCVCVSGLCNATQWNRTQCSAILPNKQICLIFHACNRNNLM